MMKMAYYNSNQMGQPQFNYQQYLNNTQPIFPQPTGNVYQINNTLEVANVPAGAGLSVALCFPENIMYVKSMQNGSPLFYAYKLTPFSKDEKTTEIPSPAEQPTLSEQLNQLRAEVEKLKSDLGVEQK